MKKHLQGHFKGLKDNLVEFIASTDSVDRQGESIDAQGWDLSNLGKNLPLLWAHNDRELPIGKVVTARVEGNALIAGVEFADKISEFAKTVKQMVVDGFLNAVSVGFMPKAFDNEGKMVSQELLELSVVNIPANQDALRASAFIEFQKSLDLEEKAEWDRAWINRLPDAAFAVIAPGGEKDSEGKTTPRSLRYLPHHNMNVTDPNDNSTVDKPHLRNALARVSQTNLPDNLKQKAQNHLERHAKALGIGQNAEDEIEIKEGRVLSEKNRNSMRIARDSMSQAISTIDEILNATEPPAKKGDAKIIEPVQTREKRIYKSVRLMDKIGEAIIHELKNGGEKT